MSPVKFVIRNLVGRWRSNLSLALTVVITTAVLSGALLSQDSVQASLERVVYDRLGRIQYAAETRGRFFSAGLSAVVEADTGADAAHLLAGIATARNPDGELSLPDVKVYGVTDAMADLGLTFADGHPEDRQAYVNKRLAEALDITVGDPLVLRVGNISAVPGEAPFGSEADGWTVVRLAVKGIIPSEGLGNFSLRANQIPPYNVFVDYRFFSELVEVPDKGNIFVSSLPSDGEVVLDESIQNNWSLIDAGLQNRLVGEQVEIISNRVFIDPKIAEVAETLGGRAVVTYFVDEIASPDASVPYSFVTATQESRRQMVQPGEILLTRWAAENLKVGIGDSVQLRYRIPDGDGGLADKKRSFVVVGLTDIEELDRWYMPPFPGFQGVENCTDWSPSAPLDLSLITERDELYWDEYGGSPKAYVSLADAKEMWTTVYGSVTAYRFPGVTVDLACQLATDIVSNLSPGDTGFVPVDVRESGISASKGGTDFGQLFLGLSFFLIVASVALTALVFGLSAHARLDEISTLSSVGFSRKRITALVIAEGGIVAALGTLLGIGFGIVYNGLILFALRTVWIDAVRFTGIKQSVSVSSLIIAGVASMVVSLAVLAVASWKLVHRSPELMRRGRHDVGNLLRRKILLSTVSIVLGVGAVGFVVFSDQTLSYLVAGACVFLSLLSAVWLYLTIRSERSSMIEITPRFIGTANAVRRRRQSMAMIGVLAVGVFSVILVGANRQVRNRTWDLAQSGTGGFELVVETTAPLMANLDTEETLGRYRMDETVFERVHAVSFRLRDGDDASCLNLNIVEQPRLLGVDPAELSGSFSFASIMDGLSPGDDPWMLLSHSDVSQPVYAAIDLTVLTWGLGKTLGDSLVFEDEFGERFEIILAAGLNNSIFQGNVLVDEQVFQQRFPSIGGKRMFLVDVDSDSREAVKQNLQMRLADSGVSVTSAQDRLEEFYSVENTYLSIFMTLGWLGVLLGTVGLGAVAYRNIVENSGDVAVLRAIGIRDKLIRRVALWEHLPIAVAGVFIGAVSASVAAIPSAFSRAGEFSPLIIIAITGTISVSTVVWIWLASALAMKRNYANVLREE